MAGAEGEKGYFCCSDVVPMLIFKTDTAQPRRDAGCGKRQSLEVSAKKGYTPRHIWVVPMLTCCSVLKIKTDTAQAAPRLGVSSSVPLFRFE